MRTQKEKDLLVNNQMFFMIIFIFSICVLGVCFHFTLTDYENPYHKVTTHQGLEHFRDRYVRDIYTAYNPKSGSCEVRLNTVFFHDNGPLMCDAFNEFMNKHTTIVGSGSWVSPTTDIAVGFIKCTMPNSREAQHMCQDHHSSEMLVTKMNSFARCASQQRDLKTNAEVLTNCLPFTRDNQAVSNAKPIVFGDTSQLPTKAESVKLKPVAEKAQPKPVAEKVQPKPVAEKVQPKPAAAKVQPKPTAAKAQPKPTKSKTVAAASSEVNDA